MGQRIVSATRVIAASPDAIFDVLADPRQHPRIDGSGNVKGSKSNPDRLSLGAKFSMEMKMGVPYTTKNVVVAFEENKVIAWHHIAPFIWRYELSEVDGGTQVTETFDYSALPGIFLLPTKTPEKNRVAMERTLERLDTLVTSGALD